VNGGEAHARLTAGSLDTVMDSLAAWAWEHRDDASIVARYRAYVEWLVEHGPDDAGEAALTAMEMYPWSSLGA
jgi:hypothetical protein